MAKKTSLTNEEQVRQWMDASASSLKTEIETIRTIIKKVDKRIHERIKWNAPSYYFMDEDIVTFGPERKGKLLLVFHHPFIVKITSGLLEGDYKDRRLANFEDAASIKKHKKELERIVSEHVQAIEKKRK